MSVIDEIQVLDESGEVEVRIVPPDHLSQEAEILMTLPCDSVAGEYVLHRCLRGIERLFGLPCRIVGLVHGGEDRYTVRTADDGFTEIRASAEAKLADLLREAAGLVEALAFCPANKFHHRAHQSNPRRYGPKPNRPRPQPSCTAPGSCVRWPRPPSPSQPPGKPEPLNKLAPSPKRTRTSYALLNKLRSV